MVISFNADGKIPLTTVKVDKKYVVDHLNGDGDNRNLKKYIL